MRTIKQCKDILANPNGREKDYSDIVLYEEVQNDLWKMEQNLTKKSLKAFDSWLRVNFPPELTDQIILESINNYNARMGVPF